MNLNHYTPKKYHSIALDDRYSLQGDLRGGRLLCQKNIDAVRELIKQVRPVTYHEIEASLRISISRQECIDELNSLYAKKSPYYSTVENWYKEFNRGRRSFQDDLRGGWLLCQKTSMLCVN